MKINYIEEQFGTLSLFTDESVFDPAYVPHRLLHRENELIALSRIFLPVIKNPFGMSRKLLIMGNIGVGKTVTLIVFSRMLEESVRKRGLNLRVVHINCRTLRSSYLIMKTILDNLLEDIPSRGLSSNELYHILVRYLQKNKIHLILILDEMDYLARGDPDLIYSLSRINEISFSGRNYLSIIGVVKDYAALNRLDSSTASMMQNEILTFRSYSKKQIFDILKDRVIMGIKPGVVNNDILDIIAEIASKNGDMRKALILLRNAVICAEKNYRNIVIPEDVRNANAEFLPISTEDFTHLTVHELITLKAICDLLGIGTNKEVTISDVKEEYISLCNSYNLKARAYTRFWEYIKSLEKYGFIKTRVVNKDIKGRQTRISIPDYSVRLLGREIEKIIMERREL